MRAVIALLLCTALAGPAQAITFDEARHLLARTGFGVATPAEIKTYMPLTYEEAVTRLLDGVRGDPVTPLPAFKTHPSQRGRVKTMSAEERKAFQKRRNADKRALKHWWLWEMIDTPSPLRERLVLFWSNHFVSEFNKVNYSQPMFGQQTIFREEALGRFANLLKRTSTSPAMLVYLDGNKNVKGKPNENFAREVLELFTLGEGQGYTERDIREAARAFTGWRVNFNKGGFVLNNKLHDDGRKTFLSRQGFFDGGDVLDIILDHPRVPEFIAEKLWREFVGDGVDPTEIRRLAQLSRDDDLRVRPILKGILLSAAFRDPANRGTMVKSPVDLVVGTARLLKVSSPPIKAMYAMLKRLGQDLFDPPDVKGWRGGTAWISATTALHRRNFVSSVRRMLKITKPRPAAMMKPIDHADADVADLVAGAGPGSQDLQRLVLALPPVLVRSTHGQGKHHLANLMADPVYQLK